MKTLLFGGTIVSGNGCYTSDVLIENEKIIAIGKTSAISNLVDDNTKKFDVTGKLLFPGFIDAHTHFDLSVAGTVTADNFLTGTQAALKGGTTTIIDFATQYPGESLSQALNNWHKKADNKCSCDYSFHMSISEWTPSICQEVQKMMDEGISSFKLYMTYDTMVNDKTMFQILNRLKQVNSIVGVHCENDGIIAALRENAINKKDVSNHYKTRPDDVEAEAINRLLSIAKIINIPVIIVHLTCKKGYDVILNAKKHGQKIYVETCPQYLLLDNHFYDLPSYYEASKFVCAPPLRTKNDQECLWKGLANGVIQTISTDHCSFTTAQKALGENDFTKIPGGVPGVEHRGNLIYTYGVKTHRINLETMCRVLSENPAKLYGMYPKKGIIAPGSDADIVVLNPNVTDVITAKNQIQNTNYTPYEGMPISSRIEDVFLRGHHVIEHSQITQEKMGIFIKRKSYNL